MKAEFITPFVTSTRDVLEVMTSTECEHSRPELKTEEKSWGHVTGVININSDQMKGVMMLSFEESCILSIVARMLGEECVEINDTVIDAVSELTNMICGGAKRHLNQLGHQFDLAVPDVIVGKNKELPHAGGSCISLPFVTDNGSFVVEANLELSEG